MTLVKDYDLPQSFGNVIAISILEQCFGGGSGVGVVKDIKSWSKGYTGNVNNDDNIVWEGKQVISEEGIEDMITSEFKPSS